MDKTARKLNILMLTADFPPEIGSAAQLFYELGTNLIRRGHRVTVVTTFPRVYSYRVVEKDRPPKKTRKLLHRENVDGIRVIRLRNLPLFGKSLFGRGLEHFILPPILAFGGLFAGKHDAVLIYSPPLPLGIAAWFLGKMKRIPVFVNIQDLYPQAVIDSGLLRNPILIRIFEIMEHFIYTKADILTVHSSGNRDFLISRGASENRVEIVPNWVDVEEIKPSSRQNDFRNEFNLNGKFVVSYAGIMSPAQALDDVIQGAALLRDTEDILFLIVGDGLEKKRLVAETEKLGLTNVRFLPMQSRVDYPKVLHASDAGLVTLKKEKTTPVVPAKLLSIMSSGRPVIASVPPGGDVPKIIQEADCGLVAEPGNPESFARAVIQMKDNPSLAASFGKNGRQYAEDHFSLEHCSGKYEDLFQKVCGTR